MRRKKYRRKFFWLFVQVKIVVVGRLVHTNSQEYKKLAIYSRVSEGAGGGGGVTVIQKLQLPKIYENFANYF